MATSDKIPHYSQEKITNYYNTAKDDPKYENVKRYKKYGKFLIRPVVVGEMVMTISRESWKLSISLKKMAL